METRITEAAAQINSCDGTGGQSPWSELTPVCTSGGQLSGVLFTLHAESLQHMPDQLRFYLGNGKAAADTDAKPVASWLLGFGSEVRKCVCMREVAACLLATLARSCQDHKWDLLSALERAQR